MSALFSPIALRGLTLRNRIMISPMCQYSAEGGEPNSWHLMHLGTLALSGAGLMCIEGTAVEVEGRITPGDLGLWDDRTEAAFRPVLTVVRKQSKIPIAIQLAHAGRKGSSRIPWEGGAQIPSSEGGWLTHAPSALEQRPGEEKPLALDTAGMARIRTAFAEAAKRAHRLGLDAIEIHGAHGYLIHEFLSPISNRRTDEYGGSLHNRCRYPLEVFAAMRAVWPAEKPTSVRISAHDWAPGGNTPEDAVEIAELFKDAGADMIDVSSGQTTRAAQPMYGRMYQTPFADRIRNEVGIATIAVGAIFEPDHVNSIIAAGRADLAALARPHLADPYWTLHAAAQLGYRDMPWPQQYLAGRDQLYRNIERAAQLQERPEANG